MKYEVMLKVEAISKNSSSVINSLMEKGVFSKKLTRHENSLEYFYGEDWFHAMIFQIEIARQFVETSVKMEKGIPDIGDDSLVCLAVYNAAKAAESGIPTKHNCIQEFYRLLMEMEVE